MTCVVDFVETESDLAALLPDWQDLWDGSPHADLFAHPQWFSTWWTHFGTGGGGGVPLHWRGDEQLELPAGQRRLLVAAAYEQGRLVGVWPLTGVTSRWRRCQVRILCAPTNRHAPRSGPVLFGVNPVARAAVVSAMFEALRQRRDWQLFVHDGIVVPEAAGMAAAFEDSGGRIESGAEWGHSILHFMGSWEEFLRGQGRHFRKRLTQPQRALTEFGAVEMACCVTPDELEAGLIAFDHVEAGSWKADGGETIAASDARGHYTDLVRRFGQFGACHLWLLRIDAEPAAAFITFALRGTVYLLKTSYQSRFASARHAPSRVLLSHLIEHYWRAGWRLLDCVGRMPFVERWSREVLPMRSWIGYSSGPLASTLYWIGRVKRLQLAGTTATSSVPTSAGALSR
jgi:hypothetical protein